MLYVVHFAIVGVAFIFIVFALLYKTYVQKQPHYRMPYVSVLREQSRLAFTPRSVLLNCAWHATILILLAFVVAQVRDIDEQSCMQVEGSDIILLFDVSGSMQLFDDLNDQRSRFDVAKKEILSFIEQRTSDPIGLVLFGATAVSRCPVTLDKNLLKEIVTDVSLGDIAHNSTFLGIALGMAVNRLRTSSAKSKIIIMLTDGAPSEGDIPLEPVIELAKKYGIKVYTIGVGGNEGGYAVMPGHGLIRCETPLNVPLLSMIASQTGGAFFRAEKPADIKRVYQTIDELEKTSYEVPLYTRYYDYGIPLLMIILVMMTIGVVQLCWRRVL